MSVYRYDELKDVSKKIRAELASEGIILEKKARRKPRDEEKKELLLKMALNRLKKYPPQKTEQGLLLPYFKR
ncbi:MAG: hypothetical protein ACK4TF_06235 [Thermodesulfovibrionales bacterium]